MAVQPTHCGMYRKPKLSLRSQCVGHVTESAYSTSICQTCWWSMIAGLTQFVKHDCWSYTTTHTFKGHGYTRCAQSHQQKFLKCIRLAERRPVCVLLQDMLEQRGRQGFFPQSLTTIYPTATTHNSRLYTSLLTINPLLSIYPTVDNTPNVDHIPNCRQKKTLSAIHPT